MMKCRILVTTTRKQKNVGHMAKGIITGVIMLSQGNVSD